jgi:hypothetical protein
MWTVSGTLTLMICLKILFLMSPPPSQLVALATRREKIEVALNYATVWVQEEAA